MSQHILQPSLILQPLHRFTTSQLILHLFRCFTYVTAYSTTLPHSPTLTSFPHVTAHSSTLPPLHLWHSLFYKPASFSNPYIVSPRHSSFSISSAATPTSQLILQPCLITTSQLILQPFRRFTYVTAYSSTLPHSPTLTSFPHVTAYSSTLPPLQLLHNLFYNPSSLHLCHLASRP